MNEVLDVALSAGTLLVGLAIGNVQGRRRAPKPPAPPKQPKPICGCKHDLSMHDPKIGICHTVERVRDQPIRFGSFNETTAWSYKMQQCTCRQYVGPKPIDTYFSTPMILPQGDEP